MKTEPFGLPIELLYSGMHAFDLTRKGVSRNSTSLEEVALGNLSAVKHPAANVDRRTGAVDYAD